MNLSMGVVLALLAGLVLVVLDYVILFWVFFFHAAAGEYFSVILVVCALAALVLRRRWLLIAAQSLVTALTIMREVQLDSPLKMWDSIQLLVILGLGHILAWLVARGLPRRLGWL